MSKNKHRKPKFEKRNDPERDAAVTKLSQVLADFIVETGYSIVPVLISTPRGIFPDIDITKATEDQLDAAYGVIESNAPTVNSLGDKS